MSQIKVGITRAAALLRRPTALFSLGFLLLFAQPGQAQEPLKFFKNYFITGDYVVRGASLWRKGINGKATVSIPPLGGADGVPPNADILAAFLYVQTAEKIQGSGIDHARFTGHDLGPFRAPGSLEPGSGTFAKALVDWNTAPSPCWSVAYPGGRKLVTYRVDVLRFLPIDPATQKHSLTATPQIVVPDAGAIFGDDNEGSWETFKTNLPRAIGASVVVVYRHAAKPYSAVVLYDGAFTKRAFARMDQPIKGFYQASTNPSAKLTPIVGDGSAFLSERVYLGGQLIATNPFVSSLGPKWDNPTFPNAAFPYFPLPPGAAETVVTVDRHGLLSDCLTFSGFAFRTTVQDDDGDGLLNIWEESQITLYDPNNQPLPKLPGANSKHKDIFSQIDYMYTGPGTSPGPDDAFGVRYGGVLKPHHTHKPTDTSLQLAAEAFKNAPVINPDGFTGIIVHFDVGDNYQPLSTPSVADCANPATWNFACAIIPVSSGAARGGQAVDEMITACTWDPDHPHACHYPDYKGVVGWKTGFRLLRDDLRNGLPQPPFTLELCDAPGNDGPGEPCERQFDANRRHTYHYLFSAHFVGIPVKSCLKPDGPDADHEPDGGDLNCEQNDLDFRRPRTNSAIADFDGGDGLLTLGAFDNALGEPVGTPEQFGATIMHEWGHNWDLKHGGPANPKVSGVIVPQIPREPNCKSNYLSIMNYLFQLRLLPNVNGIYRMDFSRAENPPIPSLSESGLPEAPLGSQLYRTGWYAPIPLPVTLPPAPNPSAATKHCDGSELSPQEQLDREHGGGMMRVDATSVLGKIDWNADGDIFDAPSQDINFNGLGPEELKGASDDWGNIRLQETAGRRNVGGAYVDTLGRRAVGPMSLDVGSGDIGSGDIGSGDIGSGDIGSGDIGSGDIGSGDIGSGDIGSGDIGSGDIGSGDIGSGDIGRGLFGGGDPDVGGENEPPDDLPKPALTAPEGDASTSPPTGLIACLTSALEGVCVTNPGQDPNASTPVYLTWQPPKLGPALVVNYKVFRFEFVGEGEFVAPAPAALPTIAIATVTEGTSYSDYLAPAGKQLAYFIRASWFDGETEESGTTGISNFATVTTPAPPPPPPGPSVPVLVAPINFAFIPQNNSDIGCSLLPGVDATRGRGFRIAFNWNDSSSANGIVGYNIFATHIGALIPIVNMFVDSSQFTYTSCNSFVAASNLTGWQWRVQAMDSFENLSDWSPWADFQFEPCILDNEASCHAAAPPSGSGSITDPSADAGGGGNPDLVSATVVIQENFVTLRVRFATGTFNPTTSLAQFLLDTDQNAATGHPGTDSGCVTDAALLGSEYLVELGSTVHGTQATVSAYGGTCNSFPAATLTGAGSVVYLADGMDVTFARSLIGNDDGLLNFKVVSFSYLPLNAPAVTFTGVLDRMTDTGQAPGVVVPQ